MDSQEDPVDQKMLQLKTMEVVYDSSVEEDESPGADRNVKASPVSNPEYAETPSKGLPKKKWYPMAFKKSWLANPELKSWVVPDPRNKFRTSCRFCRFTFKAPNKTALVRHGKSVFHKLSIEAGHPVRAPRHSNKKSKLTFQASMLTRPELADWICEIPNNPSRAWCKYCATRLTPRIHFLQGHAKSRKHRMSEETKTPQPPPDHDEDGFTEDAAYMDGDIDTVLDNTDYDMDVTNDNSPAREPSGGRPRRQRRGSLSRDASPPVESDFAGRITDSIGIGNRKVGFLGAGQISQAIAQGMLEHSLLLPHDVLVSAPTQRNLAQWKRWKCNVNNDNDEVVRQSDVIFLAVKSSVLRGMIAKLTPVSDGKTRLVISVAPGVPRDRLIEMLSERLLPLEAPPSGEGGDAPGTLPSFHVVRVVPNKMMAVGAGFCAYSMGPELPHALYLVVETMFSALGRCEQVDEAMVDTYSTVVSCGAAFTCAFIEAIVQGGVNQNLSWDDAFSAAVNVVSGTSQLLIRSGVDVSTLRKTIATPGGSTVAALGELQRCGLDHYVISAMELGRTKTAEAGSKV